MTEAEKTKLVKLERKLYGDMRSMAKAVGRNNIDFERTRSKWFGVYEACCALGLGDVITDEE